MAAPTAPVFRTTSELSRELAETLANVADEMHNDSAELQRDVLLWQRGIRFAAAGLGAVAALAMVAAGWADGPRLARGPAWDAALGVAGAYLLFTALVGWFLGHGSGRTLPPRLPALVQVVDVLVGAAYVHFVAPPAHAYFVLLVGFLVLQLTVFYFGRASGAGVAAVTGVAYAALAYVVPPQVPGERPAGVTVAAAALAFAFAAGVLIQTLGGFRDRMRQLRAFCMRVEHGDLSQAPDFATDLYPDELTLLARSFGAMRNRLIELIGTDPLTGCLNRRAFEMRLSREWRQAKRRGATLAVLAIDCDRFKPINDTHGHAVGDVVLQELAEIMRTTGRETDAIARLGGDEFVILLPDTAWQGAMTFAERLRRSVDDHRFCGDLALHVSISVGLALARGTEDVTGRHLLEEADRSLYKAKSGGRNRISA
ncbi:MAG: diguanylate cyclase [Gemmatimonadaceae bacterium]